MTLLHLLLPAILVVGALTAVASQHPTRGRAALAALLAGLAVASFVLTSSAKAGTKDADEAKEGRGASDDKKGNEADKSGAVTITATAARMLNVKTTVVTTKGLSGTLETTGRVLPIEGRVTRVGPPVNGRLLRVLVRVGDRVTAGQAVALLDSVDVAQAANAYRTAGYELALAQRTLAARRVLVDSGSFTAAPLEETRKSLAEANLEQAQIEADLGQARNELETAKASLARNEHLAASGSFTTAAAEDAQQKVADAEQALAAAREAVSASDAECTAAASEVEVAQTKLAHAKAAAERVGRLAATGDMDSSPLEAAQTGAAIARAALAQAEVDVAQAKQQLDRGEGLYKDGLIALNDLEARRAALRNAQTRQQEAQHGAATADEALARQRRIYDQRMNSGKALAEASDAVADSERELAAAKAKLGKLEARHTAAEASVGPAQQRLATARAGYMRESGLATDKTRAEAALADARLRVAQAERTVTGKEHQAEQSRNKVQVAREAYERERRLFADKVRAREQLLEVERAVLQAQITRDNAGEVLRILGSAPGTAPVAGARGQVPVRSPLAGVVTKVSQSLGEMVRPDAELLTVTDLAMVYVETDLTEQDLPRIHEGLTAEVRTRGAPESVFRGYVATIGSQLDPATRTGTARLLVANRGASLKPGMFANVSIRLAGRAGIALPVAAVQDLRGKKVVFVQVAETTYAPREVTTGDVQSGQVTITTGLKPGDRVVTEGAFSLKSEALKSALGD